MAKYLALFNDTLNDIEINGFTIMTDKEIERFEELASSINWEIIYPIGNDELVYVNGEDLLTRIEYKEISKEEDKALKKLFNTGEFGIFIGESFLENLIEEEEEELDEEELDEEEEDFDDDDEF